MQETMEKVPIGDTNTRKQFLTNTDGISEINLDIYIMATGVNF
jgi:hypothetical protein